MAGFHGLDAFLVELGLAETLKMQPTDTDKANYRPVSISTSGYRRCLRRLFMTKLGMHFITFCPKLICIYEKPFLLYCIAKND